MAQPVGNTTTPVISAQGLGTTNSKIEAGHIIVCPPEKMYKYSIYDELNLSKDSYKDLLNAVEPKKIKRQRNTSKLRSFAIKALNITLIVGGSILLWKNFGSIKNFFAKMFKK